MGRGNRQDISLMKADGQQAHVMTMDIKIKTTMRKMVHITLVKMVHIKKTKNNLC